MYKQHLDIFVLMERREQIIFWISAILKKNLAGLNYRAFIFGSQANLTELKRSDIDIGLIGNEPISPKYLAAIEEEIENLPMLYKIDLVNFNEVDECFKTIALKNAEWL